MRMHDRKAKSQWCATRDRAAAFGLTWFCLIGALFARAQVGPRLQESDAAFRLLTVAEGRSIVSAAFELEEPQGGTKDCSHLVHAVYVNAGFEYPYASSFEIYAGDENFARVKFPHAGDLIAWRGHVGIVVNPQEHSFYSLVRTGLEEQNYEGAYWRSRGRPRFYRFKVENVGVLNVAKTHLSSTVLKSRRPGFVGPIPEERTTAENSSSNRPPTAAVSERAAEYDDSSKPSATTEAATPFEIPTSAIIATGNKPPTREEVAEGISELSDALGSLLRTDDPLKTQVPVVIVEHFSVERLDLKRDHGWAQLVVDFKVWIGGGAAQMKRRREKVRWELRRTESGWEVVTPADRTYVPHDVAVKNLAAQLARLTESDGAAEHQEAVLRQESQLANLLSTLLEDK
jgi:hypothetical protein